VQLLKVLAQGTQPAEVLLSHSISLRGQEKGQPQVNAGSGAEALFLSSALESRGCQMLKYFPWVSLTQSHEGHNMKDPRGSQVMKLEVIILQKRMEEPAWWHAEPPLIERHKVHHIPLRKCGERRVLGHTTSLELHRRHKPMLHEFLQMAQGARSPILLCHGSRRTGRQHL
jgi:hypothetical protein